LPIRASELDLMQFPLAVAKDTVVSIEMEMQDAHGVLLHASQEAVTYLHGGYGELLEALETALEGKQPGDEVSVQLEPEEAFGDYDAELLRVEPAARYGEGLTIGMQVEEDFGDESRIYTVTDVAGGKAVLDANHPLAGMALRFYLKIIAVRAANPEEIRQGVSLP
jgi:FKBP-type peptidyl-prolyl cis-trans isomerase SlyD